MQNMPIAIFRGDDTDALGYQTIVGTIRTDLDLTGCKAVFKYLSFSVEFDPIPEDKKLTVIIPASETKKFPPGLGYASLRVYDSEGKLCTFSNRIMVFVATKTPMFGNAEFEVDFNVRPELEPLKIFVGPNPDDFDEYRGFLEKVIDRASAQKYGLSILLDAIDSDLGADDGVAATPTAVKAAYDAIVGKLTDDYYTKGETDEAIDRVAAYYITYDAAGNPFPTYAALANAQTVYSGGTVRVPTRNDYCVVLADETHDNAEYRYIYAVAEGQTTGSWQPQFPVEGVMTVDQSVTKDSQNPVNGGGVWSAIWGALTALPTGFSSLYDWCAAQLAGKADDADVALTPIYSDTPTFSEWVCDPAVPTDPGGMPLTIKRIIYNSGYWVLNTSQYGNIDATQGSETDTTVVFSNLGYHVQVITATRTRTDIIGYQLGSQSDKPLASEAEAEALRNGKLDKSGGTMTGNLTAYTEEGAYAEIKAETKEGSIAIRQTGRVSTLETDDYTFVLPDHDGIIALDRDLKTKLNASSAAPAFYGHNTYAVNDLCTYNGVVYRCKVGYTATASSATPDADTTHWEAKPISDLFVPLTGGTMTGRLDIEHLNSTGEVYFLAFAAGDIPLTLLLGFDGSRYFFFQNSAKIYLPVHDGTIALTADLRYALTTKTIDNGAVTLDDRAINAVAVSSSLTSLTINFPTATSGKARDFGLRLTVASGVTTAPQIVLPQGVTCENADGEAPEIGADGAATILYFTETASGVFLVKGEVLQTITQA